MKAYDRVNSQYLRKILIQYKIPEHIVTCIISFFFRTQACINLNGFISDQVTQRRGLRQGDSLPPILFNLALEPLLLSIPKDQTIKGIVPRPITEGIDIDIPEAPKAMKVLAYADDVII